MPLFKTIQANENTIVYVWKIEEVVDELRDNIHLNERSISRIEKMKSELHQRGFLSVRYLLKEAGYSDDELFYTSDGKPHLKDGNHISITHSYTFSAIIVSTTQVGIDMEMNREKIKRIAHKFVDSENDFLVEENLIEQLTVIWGAKESLFKIHPDGGLLFREHLPIESFKLTDTKTKGWIKKDNYYENYDIFFEQIENFTLVYAMN
ncbi:4'-phosphopantetheinyl transferase family protein [Urechidicola vernalis]|uniref:4'-phosphopantetheinyl transferase superfamily protein n=1 Tax=Urechidicola vernalis TaxID=3075600 RepID=A0ABU2Y707_9FLAO|nr:4'-phosphopantetheinyl transferase superfamily protein [Urechidicola sp. P050]MDT0553560.1 4'-phosphopantetheinyl transferase superfamily protein [Urechidicola sp. P050]